MLHAMLFANANEHKHVVVPDQYLASLRAIAATRFLGAFVPAPCLTYRVVRQQVAYHLVNGLPESDLGTDPLDRIVVGLEERGVEIRKGQSAISLDSRFVAMMVLALRCSLGRLSVTEANKMVVAREYRRICRARDVRLCVVESCRVMVEEVYFKEERMDTIVTKHARLPRWLEWLLWFYEPKEKLFSKYA